MNQLEDVATRHAKALGYAEAMLTTLAALTTDETTAKALRETLIKIERICKGEPV